MDLQHYLDWQAAHDADWSNESAVKPPKVPHSGRGVWMPRRRAATGFNLIESVLRRHEDCSSKVR